MGLFASKKSKQVGHLSESDKSYGYKGVGFLGISDKTVLERNGRERFSELR